MNGRRKTRLIFFPLLMLLAVGISGCDDDEPTMPQNNPPNVPFNFYPPDGSTGQSRSPLFSWEASDPDGDPLRFSIKLVLNDEVIWRKGSIQDTYMQCPMVLEENTTYHWTVEAVDDYGRASKRVDELWVFTTGTGFNNPPALPKNPYPEHGQDGITPDVVMTWECFDPDGDDIFFDVLMGGTQDLKMAGQGISNMSFAPDTLLPDTTYYWKVRAFDSQGDTTEAPPDYTLWQFRTSEVFGVPPDAPTAVYPLDGATGVPTDTTLMWSCNDPDGDPLTFDVHMRKVGEPLVMIGHNLSDYHLDISGLEYGTKYDWQVTAQDKYGLRTSGAVWGFTTEQAPAYPGVYAEFVVHRSRYVSKGIPPDPDELIKIDHLSARFDSVYAPDGYIHPRHPAGVGCSNVGAASAYVLWWEDSWKWFYYNNSVNGYFLGPGVEYYFTVNESDGVPSLQTYPILFPECSMNLVAPDAFSYVSRDGFGITWAGYDGADCPAMVRIRIYDLNGDWTDVDFQTENDGSYAFTNGELSLLDPMTYQIQVVLIVENSELISAPGYDPRSFIRAETWSTLLLYLQ